MSKVLIRDLTTSSKIVSLSRIEKVSIIGGAELTCTYTVVIKPGKEPEITSVTCR
jgi:hypothetical protein